ncbi:MAG: sporulation protein [Peptococcaceae bacterium]|nr:sporulation protein [Peptococcaceae bacterium]
MQDNFSISENINNIFDKLESFFKTKTVVGDPIQVGEVTPVPFIDISFGLGTGGGNGIEEKGNKGSGGGAGSGGKITSSAVLVIKGDQVELLPIKKAGGLEKLIDMVPGIVEKVKDHKCCE